MKVTNNKSGITLIALVITIIVMLILVAVTISMAINGGLFGYAGNAAKDTELARQKEEGWANVESGLSTDELIAKYTTREIEEIHNWTRGTGEDIDKFTCSHCDLELQMGQTINYTPSSSTTSSAVSGTESGAAAGIAANEFDAANYGTGGAQQIAQDSLTWVVLGIEDQNGNGTNETLLITSAIPTTSKLSLFGAAAYNNGPTIMEKVCKDLYSSTAGEARSITIDDVNNALGWTDTRALYQDLNADYVKIDIKKFSELTTQEKQPIIANGTSTPDEISLDDHYIDGYYYWAKSNNSLGDPANTSPTRTTTTVEKDLIFGTSSNIYWIKTRGMFVASNNSGFGSVDFGPGYVRASINPQRPQLSSCSVFTYSPCYFMDETEHGYTYSLRPVIPLITIPTVD